MAQTVSEPRGRRVTVDLTPAAAQELDRLRSVTGLSIAELFRTALSLLRIYVQAQMNHQEIRIVDPKAEAVQTRIEVPTLVVHGTGNP